MERQAVKLLSATKIGVSSLRGMLDWSDRLGSDEIADDYKIFYKDLKS